MEPNNSQGAGHQPSDASQAENHNFGAVRERLLEIATAVENPELSIDEVLDLYEEAVSLGLKATDLLELDITEEEVEAQAAAQESEETAATDIQDTQA